MILRNPRYMKNLRSTYRACGLSEQRALGLAVLGARNLTRVGDREVLSLWYRFFTRDLSLPPFYEETPYINNTWVERYVRTHCV